MGDPRKHRKKYATPSHPWQKERIVEEKALMKEYGLTNKTEIWKANSLHRSIARQAKALIAARGAQAIKEKELLLKRVARMGVAQDNATLDDLLGLTIKNILDRRLQTIVSRKGISRSVKQARQFIVHGHIRIGDDIVTAPGHLVTKKGEAVVMVRENSALADETHPERMHVPTADEIAAQAKAKDAEALKKKEAETKEEVKEDKPKKKPKKEKKKEADSEDVEEEPEAEPETEDTEDDETEGDE